MSNTCRARHYRAFEAAQHVARILSRPSRISRSSAPRSRIESHPRCTEGRPGQERVARRRIGYRPTEAGPRSAPGRPDRADRRRSTESARCRSDRNPSKSNLGRVRPRQSDLSGGRFPGSRTCHPSRSMRSAECHTRRNELCGEQGVVVDPDDVHLDARSRANAVQAVSGPIETIRRPPPAGPLVATNL